MGITVGQKDGPQPKGQGRGNEVWIYLVPVGGIKPPAAGHQASSITYPGKAKALVLSITRARRGVCGLPAALGSRSVPSHRKENHTFCERMEDLGPVPISYFHYNRDNRDKRDKRDKLKNLFCASMPFQEGSSFA